MLAHSHQWSGRFAIATSSIESGHVAGHILSMSQLPPLMRDQRKVDADHLKLLAVFHFVLAGLAVVGLGFLFMHWFFIHAIIGNPEMIKNAKGGPPPEAFFAIFKWFYLFMGACIVTMGVANLVSGLVHPQAARPDLFPYCGWYRLHGLSLWHDARRVHPHRAVARIGQRGLEAARAPGG